MSTVKAKVAQAQGAIIDALIGCETQIAAMYEGFAQIFPETGVFWSEIAAEERRHAAALQTMHAILAHGNLFRDIGRFDQAQFKILAGCMDEISESVARKEITSEQALAAALRVECSLIECRFYKDVTSDAPEFTRICNALRDDTERHISKLTSMSAKAQTAGR